MIREPFILILVGFLLFVNPRGRIKLLAAYRLFKTKHLIILKQRLNHTRI